MRRTLLIASFLGLLAGCSPFASPPPSLVPTPYPPEYIPTVIALTAEAANISATETFVVSAQNDPPTETPEPTFTPTPFATWTPTSIPEHSLAAIRFLAPGPMSKVASPINLRMNVAVGESRLLQVDLYGEDGRLLWRTVKRNVPTSLSGIPQTISIPFEIRAAAEVGRITVSTKDKQGRVQALNSVRVLLLSSGTNEINPPGNPSEPVRVFSPSKTESVSGGVLTVRGDIWPFNLQPIILELVAPDGQSLGLRILAVQDIQPRLFETTIPYQISEPVSARLVIRQDDDRIPGLYYLYSQEVLLNP